MKNGNFVLLKCTVESAYRHDDTGVLPLQWGRREAPPTVRVSLRLLHGARWCRSQGACSPLPLALGWKVLATAVIKEPAGALALQRSRC